MTFKILYHGITGSKREQTGGSLLQISRSCTGGCRDGSQMLPVGAVGASVTDLTWSVSSGKVEAPPAALGILVTSHLLLESSELLPQPISM